MLSKEKHFEHCDNIEKQYCSKGGRHFKTFNWFILKVFLLLVLLNV